MFKFNSTNSCDTKSHAEVISVVHHGFWVLLDDEELFLHFVDFPWFYYEAIWKIFNVELRSQNHLYWPELDIDLEVESIRDIERFPLISHGPSTF